MDEYEFLTRMLDVDEYNIPNPDSLIEEGVQTAELIPQPGKKGLKKYSVYRYSLKEEKNFLPFFNQKNGAPIALDSFCDYIILAPYKKKLYVILIEMKSGLGSARTQLEASKEFFNYIKNTAERIKTKNNVTFDSTKIKTIKVKLRDLKTKLPTGVSKNIVYDAKTDIYSYTTRKFDILRVCNYYERRQTA